MKLLYTVLRSGGEYGPEHAERLRDNLRLYHPDAELIVFSDIVPGQCLRMPLQHRSWPGWWSKMQLFDPEVEGDILYADLDTVISGPLDELWNLDGPAALMDFYRLGDGLGSGLMRLTEPVRQIVWSEWVKSPESHMARASAGGDQRFLEHCERRFGQLFRRWQISLPGAVLSYKADIVKRKRSAGGASVVCFHGKPRPWAIPSEELRSLEEANLS